MNTACYFCEFNTLTVLVHRTSGEVIFCCAYCRGRLRNSEDWVRFTLVLEEDVG